MKGLLYITAGLMFLMSACVPYNIRDLPVDIQMETKTAIACSSYATVLSHIAPVSPHIDKRELQALDTLTHKVKDLCTAAAAGVMLGGAEEAVLEGVTIAMALLCHYQTDSEMC